MLKHYVNGRRKMVRFTALFLILSMMDEMK